MKAIAIYTRGKNRDIYGNPYWAASIACSADDHHLHYIDIPMNWGGSDEYSVRRSVEYHLNKWGISIEADCYYEYKKVSRDSMLQHPETWRSTLRGNCTHETKYAECCF